MKRTLHYYFKSKGSSRPTYSLWYNLQLANLITFVQSLDSRISCLLSRPAARSIICNLLPIYYQLVLQCNYIMEAVQEENSREAFFSVASSFTYPLQHCETTSKFIDLTVNQELLSGFDRPHIVQTALGGTFVCNILAI